MIGLPASRFPSEELVGAAPTQCQHATIPDGSAGSTHDTVNAFTFVHEGGVIVRLVGGGGALLSPASYTVMSGVVFHVPPSVTGNVPDTLVRIAAR